MTTVNILRTATARLRATKPAPPIARSGRIVLTLLFMLLTTASAWADNPKLHVSIHYVGLTASDATVKMNYGPFQNQTVTDGYELNAYFMGRDFSFTVTSALSITTEFSATANGQSITVTKNGNTCSFTADETYDTTLDITITNAGVYTVHFDPNETDGGTGTMAYQVIERDAATNLSACTFTNNFGLIFAGWSTTANGNVVYADGASVTNLAAAGQSITLYAKWIVGYTVHFDANGGTGTMADQSFALGEAKALTANTFTREGYVFAGWSTTADGTGNSYADGKSVTNLADAGQTITLYAQWMDATQYIVHFDANGGTGTMADQVIERDAATNLSACTFTNSFGLIFAGWSTTANGNVVYADGASVTNLAAAGQSITLYAKWIVGYTVHFDANGGTGTMADQSFALGEAKALTANTFTREGYVFAGWSTLPNGSITYTDGQEIHNTDVSGGTITLYAQWTDYYTVHFDKNDDIIASGTMADQTFHAGETKQLSKCTFTGLGGYTFLGWSTTKNGSAKYADEQSVCDLTTTNGNITLYAQWQAPVIALSSTVHFDANGGTGTMADQEYSNMQWANLNANTFTRDGYTFTGWNTAADGSGDTYTNQQNIHPSSDMTLYAQWSLNTSTHYAVHFNANGGTGKMFDQAIAAGSSADLTANAFSREGYTFTGWNTEANGSGTNYADGATVSGLALAGQTAKLYAQWTPLTNLTLTANAHDGNYWTTFYCGDAGYDITTDGAYAYTAKYDNANSQLTLHKLGTAIAKDEAVIIVSATSPVSMTKGADGTKSTYNDLRGVDVRTLKSTLDNTGTGTFYILSKKDNNFGFFKYTADYMPARKAYLLIPGGNAAPGLTMVFDDETTEIKTTDFTDYTDKADAWYSLDGRQLDKQPTAKGVYIHNRRKEVVR